jgi:large subunit ribosomal protein L19
MNKLQIFNSKVSESKFKEVRPGWTIKVHQRIKEGEKTRLQAFEGTVIARKHGDGVSGTITVRKVADGIGVEKTYPIHLPAIEKVDVLRRSKVRRSKLYYLKDKSSREIRRKVKQTESKKATKEAPTEAAE